MNNVVPIDRTSREVADWTKPVRIPDGRTPPHDLDAEAAVLTACLYGPGALEQVAGRLTPEHFFSEPHRRIYEACLALQRAGQPVDTITVGGWLKQRERLEQVGGMAYLTQMTFGTPGVTNVMTYARIVWDHARARQMIATCQRIAAEGYGDVGEIQSFLDQAAAAVQRCADIGTERAVRTNLEIARGVVYRMERARQARRSGRYVTGVPTGLSAIDYLTTGLQASTLTIIGARTGVGKTALAGNIADYAASTGKGVAFFSAEMSDEEIAMRNHAARAGISVADMLRGSVPDEKLGDLQAAMARWTTLPIRIDDREGPSVDQIHAETIRCMREFNSKNVELGLIIVDYLQIVKYTPQKGENLTRPQLIGKVAESLKGLAKRTKVPVIALAQLSRAAANGPVRRPTLTDLRESGDIEQWADLVLLIHREGYYDPAKEDGSAEIIIAKHRNGRPGSIVKVRYVGEYTRFEDAPPEWQP